MVLGIKYRAFVQALYKLSHISPLLPILFVLEGLFTINKLCMSIYRGLLSVTFLWCWVKQRVLGSNTELHPHTKTFLSCTAVYTSNPSTLEAEARGS